MHIIQWHKCCITHNVPSTSAVSFCPHTTALHACTIPHQATFVHVHASWLEHTSLSQNVVLAGSRSYDHTVLMLQSSSCMVKRSCTLLSTMSQLNEKLIIYIYYSVAFGPQPKVSIQMASHNYYFTSVILYQNLSLSIKSVSVEIPPLA